MNILLERWCESRPGCRVLGWCLGTVFLGAAAWGMLLRPVHLQCVALRLQVADAVRTNVSLWPAASKVPYQTETVEARGGQPFSPLDFQADGTRLVHWKPLQSGGELTLDADWQAIPAVFSRLMKRDVQVSAFAISPHDAGLRLHMQLEQEHAE